MAKRRAKVSGSVEKTGVNTVFRGPNRGLIEPHEVRHLNEEELFDIDGVSCRGFSHSLPDSAFGPHPAKLAGLAALRVIRHFIGERSSAEIDKAFMLTGECPSVLSDSELLERGMSLGRCVARVIPEWQKTLRERLSDIEIDTLIDAITLIELLVADSNYRQERERLVEHYPGLVLDINDDSLFDRGFRVGQLYERLKTSRPAERIAGSGLASHAGREQGRKTQQANRRKQWAQWQAKVDELRGYSAKGKWKPKLSHRRAVELAAAELGESAKTMERHVVNRTPRKSGK